jgi:hypothetical protein
MEKAREILRLKDAGMTQREIARATGKCKHHSRTGKGGGPD